MSLIQHVTQQEGTDRDEALVDLFLPPVDRHTNRQDAAERRQSFESAVSAPGFLAAPGRSVRRVISYDVIPKPDEPVPGEEPGGLTPYKVSTAKRIGKFFPYPAKFTPPTPKSSTGHCNRSCLLVCQRHRLWLCRPEANPHQGGRLPESVYTRGARCRHRRLLRARSATKLLLLAGVHYRKCICPARRHSARPLRAQDLLSPWFLLSRPRQHPNESCFSD